VEEKGISRYLSSAILTAGFWQILWDMGYWVENVRNNQLGKDGGRRLDRSSATFLGLDSTKTVGYDGLLETLYSLDCRRLTHPTNAHF
jgi:hypothetical protein